MWCLVTCFLFDWLKLPIVNCIFYPEEELEWAVYVPVRAQCAVVLLHSHTSLGFFGSGRVLLPPYLSSTSKNGLGCRSGTRWRQSNCTYSTLVSNHVYLIRATSFQELGEMVASSSAQTLWEGNKQIFKRKWVLNDCPANRLAGHPLWQLRQKKTLWAWLLLQVHWNIPVMWDWVSAGNRQNVFKMLSEQYGLC